MTKRMGISSSEIAGFKGSAPRKCLCRCPISDIIGAKERKMLVQTGAL